MLEHARAVGVVARDRQNDNVLRRELRRQHEAVIIAVGHDERSDEPRRNAPRRRPRELLFAFLGKVFDARGLREVLPQEVRRAGLECLLVLHHGFDRIRVDRAGEALPRAFFALDDGHGHRLARERLVDVEHAHRLFARFLLARVRGVAPLARGTRRCAKTSAFASPSERRWPIG